MIDHSDLLEIASLPMLVYDYIKNFKLNKNETIESFLNNNEINDLSDTRKEVLTNIKSYAPFGKVVDFIDDEETDLQVGITISETKKRICVVFRGSESITDWYYDLMISKILIKDNIYVHSGFYKQLENKYEKIKDKILELLKKDETVNYEIIITGHSLGGALCTLFGYLLSKEIKENIQVISFASPRVGNQGFKDDFNQQPNLKHYRVSNSRDIVTAGPMFNYKHVGTNIHVTEDYYKVYENYNYNMWFQFSLFNCWSISDHNIDLYYENIKKNKW